MINETYMSTFTRSTIMNIFEQAEMRIVDRTKHMSNPLLESSSAAEKLLSVDEMEKLYNERKKTA